MQDSNDAPPQHSKDQKPALSRSSQAGTTSSRAMLVSRRLCCASRRIKSVTSMMRAMSSSDEPGLFSSQELPTDVGTSPTDNVFQAYTVKTDWYRIQSVPAEALVTHKQIA